MEALDSISTDAEWSPALLQREEEAPDQRAQLVSGGERRLREPTEAVGARLGRGKLGFGLRRGADGAGLRELG